MWFTLWNPGLWGFAPFWRENSTIGVKKQDKPETKSGCKLFEKVFWIFSLSCSWSNYFISHPFLCSGSVFLLYFLFIPSLQRCCEPDMLGTACSWFTNELIAQPTVVGNLFLYMISASTGPIHVACTALLYHISFL